MADDPNPNPNPDPNPNPAPAAQEGLSATEVKALVGEAVDEKLQAFGGKFASKDDLAEFRSGILEDITKKIPELIPKGSSVDESSLLSKVGGMLDDKLKTIGIATERVPGPLGRWLQGV
jgi:hypothetical protein